MAIRDKDIVTNSAICHVSQMITYTHLHAHTVQKSVLATSALSAVAGPATVPVVGVEHGYVATLVLQVHLLLQRLQGFVRTHVGVRELCTGRTTQTMGVTRQVQHILQLIYG